MSELSPRHIRLEEEIDGDQEGTTDFVFCRIGESAPLKASDSQFDLQDPPSRPLAISERFRVILLAHSEGFLVAKTKDVMGLGKLIKEKGKGPCIENFSIVDVKIGKVSLLALSNDSLVLAAVVGGEIQFFYVPSLINNKEDKPSFLCSMRDSRTIKDFKWQKNSQKSFVVLGSDGLLCYGRIKEPLKASLENVDAVDWSTDGDFIAVAKKSSVSIFSSDFKEKICMSLFIQSWSDAECESVKVDSVEWIHDDSIIIGSIKVNEDGSEEGYMVQVISSGAKKFTESSCNPVVISFPCLFEGILDDILPAGAGPHLLLSYLDRWGLLLASNKKNVDQHVVLVKDTMDESYRREVSWLEFQSDKYRPSIGLQENGEDNLILGFGIDKISLYEKVEVQVDTEFKELAPYCILFCLTCDGKLAMFHVARISDTSDLPQPSIPPMDVPLEDELFSNTSKVKNGTDYLIPIDRSKQISYERASFPEGDELQDGGNNNLPEFPRVSTQLGKGDERSGNLFHRHSIGYPQQTTQLSTNLSLKNGPDSVIDRTSTAAATVSSSRTQVQVPLPLGNMSSETITTKKNDAKGTIFSDSGDKLPSGLGQTPFSSRSSISVNFPSGSAPFLKGAGGPPSMMLSSGKDAHSQAQTTFLNKSSNAEAAAATSFSSQESSGIGKITFSKQQPSFSNLRTSKQLQMLDSEPELVKQYNNVKEMARELDNMLKLIEQEGGFRDACTIFQQSAVLVLEEGLKNLSETLKIRKRYAEEALMEVQNLQRNMLQVSAKQVYMADIVKQASSTQYWDMWSRQKLSPEVEQKQQNIRKAHQNLTNQLIQLEKHFNNVEISKFGGSDTISAGQRALHGNLRQSRHSQPLHSVYTTLNSQLAAAEQLSERLRKQMDLLKLNDTSTRRTGVARELLESIGLAGEDIALKSPIAKSPFHTPDSMKKISFIDASSEGRLRRASTSSLSNVEPGTTRRRRESLERSRTYFEPSKTVVKRMTQQESVKIDVGNPFQTAKKEFDSKLEMYAIIQQKATGNSSSSTDSISKVHQEVYTASKDVQVKPSQQASNLATSSVFKWTNEPSRIPQTLVSKPYPIEDGKKTIIPTSVTSPKNSFLYGSGSPQTPESISHPMEGLPKGTMTSTPSLFNCTSSVPKESIVQMKSVSPLPTVPNLQMEAPKSVTSFNLVSNLSSTQSATTVEKAQENKQSDPKPFGEGLTSKFPGSILQSAASPQKSSALSTKSNTFSFSTMSTSTSDVGQRNHTEKTTNNEQFSVSAPNLQTKMVASLSPSTFALSAPSTSGSSAFTRPSLPTFGGSSSFQAKTVGGTSLAHSASVSTTSSAQFTSSSQSQLLGSKTDPSLTVSEGFQLSLSQPIEVNSKSEPTIPQASSHDQATSKIEPVTLQAPANMGLTGSSMTKEASSVPMVGDMVPASPTRPEEGSAVEHLAITKATENNNRLDANSIQEEEMEEEVSDASNELDLGALSGFGLGPSSFSSPPKPNPFGGNFLVGNASTVGSAPALTTQPGQLFQPPSFSLPTAQPVSPSLSVSPSGMSSGITNAFSGFGKPSQIGAAQPALGSVLSSNTNSLNGFGQPSQIGAAQQALGSVLGSFGQSRQLGPGGFGGGFANVGTSGGASSSGFSGNITGGGFAALASRGGGFAGATGGGFAAGGPGTGGFAGAAAGGFAAAASSTSGFAAAASSSSGGFAGAGTGGGFTNITTPMGGFGAAASQGSGFGGAVFGGGFGAFSSTQGSAFSVFGGSGSSGTGRPPAELFTQMRR